MVDALTKWRQILGSQAVAVETDHPTLSRVLKQKQINPHSGY